MKKISYLLVLLAFNCFAKASGYPTDISGNYDCHGTEYDTRAAFHCTMRLTKTNMTYAADVRCTDGSIYSGTAIYNSSTHSFASLAVNPKEAKETGVALADVSKNNEINSVWTYLNQSTLGHTHCVKQ